MSSRTTVTNTTHARSIELDTEMSIRSQDSSAKVTILVFATKEGSRNGNERDSVRQFTCGFQ